MTPTRDTVTTGGSPKNNNNNNNNIRISSESISFRLHKVQLDQLRQEAIEKRISLNTLVSQIVDSYVNYNSKLSAAGIKPVPKAIIVALVEAYSEAELKTIAEQVQKKITIDLAMQLRGKYDFETLVDIFDSWLRATGFSYRHDKDAENKNRHNFIFHHNLGRKYSVFAAERFKVYFEPLATKGVEYSITDNSVFITVEG